MRLTHVGLLVALGFLVSASPAIAQSTTGTVRGHVTDTQGLALPGVAITLASPNLQGVRTAVTSVNGDYIVTLLPSGSYRATLELSGFQSIQKDLTLAPTQILPLDVVLGPSSITENVEVVGSGANALFRTTQAATNFSQDTIATLPTTRDINASILMAPAVHPTGPGGAYSFSGAVSFENLFMVNGVSVTDNLRGQPYDLYIEDAIQETTVATGSISAEYGRFTGGVVNVITKSGGNLFSGSVRDTLYNDKWRAFTPFEQKSIAADPTHKDTRIDKTVPSFEYTVGGPAIKDRLWFFTAGRIQTQESSRTLVATNIPYTFTEDAQRFEVNGTYSVNASHRIQGVLIESMATQENQTQNPATSMDRNSLFTTRHPMNLATFTYNGVLSPHLFVEARLSLRNETIKDYGGTSRDPITGTLLIERTQQRRYWAPTFCGVCGPEERDGADVFGKGSYFLSTKRFGSHSMAFGYDGYNDMRLANNHQEGSDYRLLGTTAIVRGTGESAIIYPQILPDGVTLLVWQPILVDSKGSNFRTHSAFYGDNWRVSDRITANLGLRYDRNHGANSVDDIVTRDGAWSPRVGVVMDPTGSQKWAVTAGIAKYVASIANTIADSSSPGGNFDSYPFVYSGPAINADPNGPLVSTGEALNQVFTWFNNNGGAALPMAGAPTVRGVTPQVAGSLRSPNAMEYSGGLSRQMGALASVRADVTYRKYHDFYAQRTNLSTGKVEDDRTGNVPPAVTGRVYDLTLVENTDLLKRQYAGLSVQGQYRPRPRVDVGANYTLSHLWGNVDAENVNSGPTASDVLQYPEYKSAAWNYPEGDLMADQRHRARLWVNYGIPAVNGLTLSLLQILESGVPYGAVGTINSANYVTNPGYVSPPSASSIAYYYTARDAFRTAGQKRTDLGISYGKHVGAAGRLELFGQLQVINVLNHYQLCACGASTVFQNGGYVSISRIDQSVKTSVTQPAAYAGFNPFTTTPQKGVNWDYGTTFGTGTSRFAYTSPRTIRLSFGLRF